MRGGEVEQEEFMVIEDVCVCVCMWGLGGGSEGMSKQREKGGGNERVRQDDKRMTTL